MSIYYIKDLMNDSQNNFILYDLEKKSKCEIHYMLCCIGMELNSRSVKAYCPLAEFPQFHLYYGGLRIQNV